MQILKKFIGNDQVADEKIRLDNDQFLRGRNAANSADISILKVNASNEVELGAVLNAGGFELKNLGAPTASSSAATKTYVDTAIAAAGAGALYARAVAVANVTVSNPGTAVFDGVTLANGELLLLTGQTAPAENGLYVFNGSGSALTRSTSLDASGEFTIGKLVVILEGTTYGDSMWALQAAVATVGTSAVDFDQVSGGGGGGGANTTLSNLTAPTDINQDLLSSASVNLGDGVGGAFTDLFLDGGINDAGGVQVMEVGAGAARFPVPIVNSIGNTLNFQTNTGNFQWDTAGLIGGVGGVTGGFIFNSGHGGAIAGDDGGSGGFTFGTGAGYQQPSGGFSFTTGPINDGTANSGGFSVVIGTAGGTGNGGNIALTAGASQAGGNPGNIQLSTQSNGTDFGSIDIEGKNVTINGLSNGGTFSVETFADTDFSFLRLSNVADPEVDQDAATKAYVDSSVVTATWAKETITLTGTDITNQFIDLANVARNASIQFLIRGGGVQMEGASYEYSVSYTGGSGGVTRITFLNDIATGGPSALVNGDIVEIHYMVA